MPLAKPSSDPLVISMLVPTRERCGIGDYSRLLTQAVRKLPEIEAVEAVSIPEGAVRAGILRALQNYLPDSRRFAYLGRRLNSGQIAHIQHQYFFFGGVAPHKNHFAALLRAVRVPVVLTVHEIADGGTVGWKQALVDLTNRRNFLHPNIREIIVHTRADAEKLGAIGVSKDRMTVLPVGIPPTLPTPSREEARAALGIAGKRVLLMFGFLSQKKGHALALEALRELPESVVLVLAGEQHPDDASDYVARLKERIAAYGLERRVLYTGYLPDARIPLIMAAADVALAPFSASSGSASLAHLLAYGLPVIASDIPPHRELLAQSPGCMLLTPDSDVGALREQIRNLLDDPELCRSLQSGAARFCAERSFEHVARETLSVYSRALRRR